MPTKRSSPARKTPAKARRKPPTKSPSKPTASAKKVAPKPVTTPAPATEILAWDNDPFAQTVPTAQPAVGTPLPRPVPDLGAGPLPVNVVGIGTPPAPARYPLGSAEFRYWAAAEAMQRAADFWAPLLPAGKRRWHPQTGGTLRAFLDDPDPDLNAYYDREGLKFFHASVGGQLIYSGESPDVVCHEFGHAVLDALRPQLFDAGSTEAAAFHESFGDMSAMLCSLQLPGVRERVLTETGGSLYASSRLSRLAEQLGWAIRQRNPSAVEPDCLRNAVNSFFYRDPTTLPPSAPASMLSSEPHSFSRVFTAAFLEAMGGMLRIDGLVTSAGLLAVSTKAAQFLVAGVLAAPVVPAYFSQVAAAMVNAVSPSDARYRPVLSSAFVRHGVLSLSAAAHPAAAAPATDVDGGDASPAAKTLAMGTVAVAPAAHAAPGEGEGLPTMPVGVSEYGLGTVDSVSIHAAAQPRRFQAASAALDLGSQPAPAPELAAKSFLEDLLRLGRLDFAASTALSVSTRGDHPFAQPMARKTHRLDKAKNGLVTLQRTRFDCGFDCGCTRP